jgi:hypothetical protein
MHLFNRNTFNQIFPAAALGLVILALVTAPDLVGTRSVVKVFLFGLFFGACASAVLYGVMKYFDRRRRT